MTLAFRPEVEGHLTNAKGPLSETENQPGAAAGLVATWVWDSQMRVAARYGFETLPKFGAEGVEVVHGVEIGLGGTY